MKERGVKERRVQGECHDKSCCEAGSACIWRSSPASTLSWLTAAAAGYWRAQGQPAATIAGVCEPEKRC